MSINKYFDILGIHATKDEKIIKRAYRKKAIKYHPDKNSSIDAKEKFIEVSEAYEQIMLAVKRLEQQSPSAENNSRKRASEQGNEKAPTFRDPKFDDLEERIKRARMRYEYMRHKEEEEMERYYNVLIKGKKWALFRTIVFFSLTVSILLFADYLFLPTNSKTSKISEKHTKNIYLGFDGNPTIMIVLETGQKIWAPHYIVKLNTQNSLYLEYTFLFKEIKSVGVGEQIIFVPEYSLMKTFPLVPILLLIPLFVYSIKAKSFGFMLSYNIVLYAFPIILAIVLISNNRLLNLIELIF